MGLQPSGRIRRPEATPCPCGDSEHYAEFEMKVGRKLSLSSYSIPGSRESVLPEFLDAVPLLEPSRCARSACCPKPPVKPDGLTSPLGSGGRGFSSPYSPPVQNKKALDNNPRLSAVRKGLEPSTSGVTGRHSNQLNYRTRLQLVFEECKCRKFFLFMQ